MSGSYLKTRSGLTLVELLVTIGILVVVLGLALGMMMESDRASRTILRSQVGIQYCQLILNEAVRTVRSAIAPANFAAAGDPRPPDAAPDGHRTDAAGLRRRLAGDLQAARP